LSSSTPSATPFLNSLEACPSERAIFGRRVPKSRSTTAKTTINSRGPRPIVLNPTGLGEQVHVVGADDGERQGTCADDQGRHAERGPTCDLLANLVHRAHQVALPPLIEVAVGHLCMGKTLHALPTPLQIAVVLSVQLVEPAL